MNQTTRPALPLRGQPITLDTPDYRGMVFTNEIDAIHFCIQFKITKNVQIVRAGDGWMLQDPAPIKAREFSIHVPRLNTDAERKHLAALLAAHDIVEEHKRITSAQVEIIKPEWDAMQDFLQATAPDTSTHARYSQVDMDAVKVEYESKIESIIVHASSLESALLDLFQLLVKHDPRWFTANYNNLAHRATVNYRNFLTAFNRK